MLNNIVDNLEKCGQHNIVQCCFHHARTGCVFFAVYSKPEHFAKDSIRCPARGKVCRKCGLKDHFESQCKTRPLRPIVTCRETALYNTSKHLAEILSPLQNHNGYSVTNSAEFVRKIANTTIDDDEIMVSFDVVSLFTAIPVDKTCEHIRNQRLKHETLQQRTKLSIDDIFALLRFTLSNSYFNYNNKTYRQLHGCAMGSPVSPIVANLCLEVIEELALAQAVIPPKTWFRSVYSIIKKHALTAFHGLLNSIDPHIKFTVE